MLRVCSNQIAGDCEDSSRRKFLRVGALALGGLALPHLLATRAAEASRYLTGKNRW